MSIAFKKNFYALFFLALWFMSPLKGLAQQEFNLHFMDRVIQSNATNPAAFTEDKLVIAAPGIAYNYGNNAFTYKDLIRKDSGRNILDIANVLHKLHNKNILQNQLNIDLVRVQLKVKNVYLTFLASEKTSIKFGYSKDLVNLLWKGNASRVGDTISLGPSINARYYRELGFGIGTKLNKWTLGGRLKLLTGLADLYTENDKITIYSDAEAYQTTISTDFVFNTSGEDNFLDKPLKGAMNFKNRGAAMDLGVTFQPNPSWTLAASFNNMGFIKWRDNISNYHSKGNYSYEGIHLNNYFEMDTFKTKNLIDTLKSTFSPVVTSSPYTSYQIPRIYISGRYEINDLYSVGLLLYTEIYEDINPAFNLYAQRKIGSALDLGISYSIKNKMYKNWGMSVSYTRKKYQVFFVTDNFFNVFNLKNSKNVNFRMGANFIFSKRKPPGK